MVMFVTGEEDSEIEAKGGIKQRRTEVYIQ